jgi:HAE1 family hydrophobic/amphiphilic exporter-1
MIAFFARHPTASNLLMIVFLVAGLLTAPRLRRETFPDFRPTEVEIRTIFRGATAEEVEEVVCQRLEDAVDSVRFVKELRSDAREGLAIVTVEMDPEGSYQAFKDEIDTAVGAIDDFPPEVEDPVITQRHTTDLVLSILIAGPLSLPDLKTYCEKFKERLQQPTDISLVRIRGFSDHQFRIELSDAALRHYSLDAAAVANIVRQQSVNLPSGVIESQDGELTVRFVEERRSPRELEELIIVAGIAGAEIRLGDIAHISERFDPEEEQVLVDGQRAGLLEVRMTRNQDVIRVADTVKQLVELERQRYPQLQFTVTQDSSTLVRDRLQLLVNNGWQGMLLVFLTLWLFFHIRLSFWVVMSLPVSFLAAIFVMPHLGLTMNMMTMVGLLLALGILMDDGIVIAENIATHRGLGKPALQAAIDGVREVQAGVFASFITTVCVLGPLAFLDGDIGGVLEVVPIVLILVILVSLIEAFFILPAHLGHAMQPSASGHPGRLRRHFEQGIDWTREHLVGRTLDTLLRWRYLWIGSVAAVFLLSIGVMASGLIKFQAFPDLDGDVIEARLVLSPGTPLARTREAVERVTTALHRVNERLASRQPPGEELVQAVYVQLNHNVDAYENGPHVATVTADLLTAERRKAILKDVFRLWRKEIGDLPDLVQLALAEPGFGPQGRSLEIRLQHDNLRQLDMVASRLGEWLNRFPGVLNLSDDLRAGKRELRLRVRNGAFALGLHAQNMANQLRTAFQGATVDEIQIGPESLEIDIRYAHKDRDSVADLQDFHFRLPSGESVPLPAVVDIKTDRAWSRIARVDGLRTVTLRGDIDPQQTNTMELVTLLRREFLPQLQQDFPGVRLTLEGEPKEGVTTRKSIFRGMLVGMLGVFILLSFQFRSYVEPLIVMAAIPLALIGVVAGHLIMRINLSMPSVLGFVSLTGIVVNDSLLLVLFLKLEREQGRGVLEAASRASRSRFRAIILTSMTTIAGLLPLLAERSLQAQVLIPLATSIAFGLAASTILVLFVIPCLYSIFSDFGWTSSEPTAAEHQSERQ